MQFGTVNNLNQNFVFNGNIPNMTQVGFNKIKKGIPLPHPNQPINLNVTLKIDIDSSGYNTH